MFKEFPLNLSLNVRLVLIMLFLTFILISIILVIYSQSEKSLLREFENQTRELSKAIQIGVEEVTSSGTTDEARLSNYLNNLNSKGVKEISIINNTDEIVASTNTAKIGQPITHKRKELIIKAELGDPVSLEGGAYNVILPVIADNVQYGYVHLKVNKDDFTDILKKNTIKRIASTLLVFGIGVVLSLLLSRHYTDPIKKIVDAARRVAAGDFNQRIQVKSKDEIGQLSDSFNFMVERLRENRALEERLREAEHLSGLGQLSRDIAHEIRNPLNFINLSVEYIEGKFKPAGADDSEKFNSLISGIKLEIQRLNKLVNDFLDYSRPIKLNLQRVCVQTLLEDVLSLIWAKAEAENIRVVKDFNADVEINVDPDLFKSCVMNVISNAFHAMGSSVGRSVLSIKTEFSDGNFVLSINDTGHGVSAENMSRIFEPFFTTKPNGIGIGLPMTRRVIEEHKGKIEFESIEGSGTEVKFILPVSSAECNRSVS